MSHAIHIEPEWIPREKNQIADYSHIVDYDHWIVNPAVFAWVNELLGPHTVDRFASHNNIIRGEGFGRLPAIAYGGRDIWPWLIRVSVV